MSQRLPALGIATALALGIAIGAAAIVATRQAGADASIGSMHRQMMSMRSAAMNRAMMNGVHADPGSNHGTGPDEHYPAPPSAIPD